LHIGINVNSGKIVAYDLTNKDVEPLLDQLNAASASFMAYGTAQPPADAAPPAPCYFSASLNVSDPPILVLVGYAPRAGQLKVTPCRPYG
jgi:hypothetical protein